MENSFFVPERQRKSKALVVVSLIGLVALVGVVCYFSFRTTESTQFVEKSGMITEDEKEFMRWMHRHNKDYFSHEEHAYRFQNWLNIKKEVELHNSRNDITHYKGINQFSDLTAAEFKRLYLGYRPSSKTRNEEFLSTDNLKESVDWRTKGAVTGVKNQGQCGSCWAFSTTGSVEGAYQLAGNSLTSFSEQQLVDCSGSYGNQGCNGGLMDNAFNYLESHKLMTEADYPYTAYDGSCHYDASKGVT